MVFGQARRDSPCGTLSLLADSVCDILLDPALSLIAHGIGGQLYLCFRPNGPELRSLQAILSRGSKMAKNGNFLVAPSVLLLAVNPWKFLARCRSEVDWVKFFERNTFRRHGMSALGDSEKN